MRAVLRSPSTDSAASGLCVDDLGVPIDNIEGMAFCPTLPDGRQWLVIVGDNNFSPGQLTQFILLALDINRVR
jgi:3-phytase/alkaline phosphatase D